MPIHPHQRISIQRLRHMERNIHQHPRLRRTWRRHHRRKHRTHRINRQHRSIRRRPNIPRQIRSHHHHTCQAVCVRTLHHITIRIIQSRFTHKRRRTPIHRHPRIPPNASELTNVIATFVPDLAVEGDTDIPVNCGIVVSSVRAVELVTVPVLPPKSFP